ncbi:MAG TPA: endonuclease V, partial [archaeon]|nr:endonuclease V [archaeon]
RQLIFENNLSQIKTVAGADAAFKGEMAYGAVAVFSMPELDLVASACARRKISFPYIPGLLSFREGPVLLECLARLPVEPEVVMFDGQGIAHPRHCGLAAHLGLILDLPALGCAKEKFFGQAEKPGLSRGSRALLADDQGRALGLVLRTRENVKPVYVSPGFKISIEQAAEFVLACTSRYRIPEPLRQAHRLAALSASSPG